MRNSKQSILVGLNTSLCLDLSRFIPDIDKVTKVKEISPTAQIWTLHYKFPPPVSPRVFTVLQIVRLKEEAPRTGYVILYFSQTIVIQHVV